MYFLYEWTVKGGRGTQRKNKMHIEQKCNETLDKFNIITRDHLSIRW